MQTIKLYRYIRPDGGVTVSTIKPEGAYTQMVRLMADDGKSITRDGMNLTSCVDTDTADGWREVDASADEGAAPGVHPSGWEKVAT